MGDESKKISDEALIRLLEEYTEKASVAHRYYVTSTTATVLAIGVNIVFVIFVGLVLFGLVNHVPGNLVVASGIMAVLMLLVPRTMMWVGGHRTAAELATWHLRRIYELASRREDLGVELDSASRMELDLRLSEAQFILTRMKRFDKPEKFARVRRVGSDSPLRTLEPDDSLLRRPQVRSDP